MEATAEFWDKLAEKYAAQPVADVPAYRAKLKATRALLTKSDTVLDLGCGTGSLALELAPHVERVHSVDVSGGMIAIAKRKAAAAGVENIQFHRQPVAELSAFAAGSFDVVCAFNILHLVDDIEMVNRRVWELLRPGGHFVSTTPCLGESAVPFGPIITVMRWLGKAPRVHIFTVGELQTSMERAGFVRVRRERVSGDRKIGFLLAERGGS